MGIETRVKIKGTEAPGFKKIEDSADVTKYVLKAISEEAKVDVQLTESAYRFTSKLHVDSDPGVGLRIFSPEDITVEQIEAQAKFEKQTSMVVAFLKSHELLCIQSDEAFWKDTDLILPQPWTAFKLQRRKEPRYQIPGAYEILMNFRSLADPKLGFKHRVMDISMSGLSFYTDSPVECDSYGKGIFIRRVQLNLENRMIFLDLRIANVVRLKNHPKLVGFKIGTEIMRISPVDRQYIAAYVARGLAQSGLFG